MTWKILRLFVNTLTGDDKYSHLSRDNSVQTIQMHLSQKRKYFSEFFWKFSKFSKKENPHSLCICDITDSERRG